MKKTKKIFISVGVVTILLTTVFLFFYSQQVSSTNDTKTLSTLNKNALLLTGFDPTIQPYKGDSKAPFVIVEFADYKCSYCKLWTEDVFPEIKKKYLDTGKAVFYYVDLPFLAPDSEYAALAGENLFQQNNEYFFTYYDLMMKHQGNYNEEWATKELIMDIVEKNIPGVDIEKFEKDLDSRKYIGNISKDIQLADSLKVDETPSIYINGKKVKDVSITGISAILEQG